MKYIETEGKTVEQAIELALYKLDKKREEVTISILDQGGLFSKAKVRVSTGEQSESEKKILKFFEDFIASTGLSCFAAVEEKEDHFLVNLTGKDVGILIGKHGDVLAGIQYLTSIILGKIDDKRVVVDSSNYNSRREESLKVLARSAASRAIRENHSVKLEYMNARERRIIHEELSKNGRVSTVSEGVEPKRYVIINLVKQKKEEPIKDTLPRDEND